MNKKIIIAIVVAVAIIALGSILFFKRTQPQPIANQVTSLPQTTPPADTAPTTRTIIIPLSSQNNSGEMGTATLSEVSGKTSVVLALSGAPDGVLQPAHIHTGTCAAIGGVSYPLTFPMNGKSETTLSVSLDELLKKLPLAINVHKSAAEASVYVACGNIATTTTTSNNAPAVTQPAANTTPAVENNRSDAGKFSTPTDNRKGADKPEN